MSKEIIKKERLLIDTDMGNDDIMAIAMLLKSPCFQITGYTLTDGVARTTAGARNLNGMLDYLGKPSPIAIGISRSFQTSVNFPPIDIQRAEELTLLKGLTIKPSDSPISEFDEVVTEAIKEPFTLFALGPMTNVAAMIEDYPGFKDKVKRIVMMGGGIDSGNVSPLNFAEYNIALDPPSANKVFQSGIPIVMVGIDATKTVPASRDFEEQVRILIPGTREGAIIRKEVINNQGDVSQYYDPLATAILVDKSIITDSKRGFVSVTQSGSRIGQTTLEVNSTGNIEVVFSANSKKFYDTVKTLITER